MSRQLLLAPRTLEDEIREQLEWFKAHYRPLYDWLVEHQEELDLDIEAMFAGKNTEQIRGAMFAVNYRYAERRYREEYGVEMKEALRVKKITRKMAEKQYPITARLFAAAHNIGQAAGFTEDLMKSRDEAAEAVKEQDPLKIHKARLRIQKLKVAKREAVTQSRLMSTLDRRIINRYLKDKYKPGMKVYYGEWRPRKDKPSRPAVWLKRTGVPFKEMNVTWSLL